MLPVRMILYLKSLVSDQCAHLFPGYNPAKIAFLVHVEDNDWQVILHTEGECSHIHNPQVIGQAFLEGDDIEFGSGWILLRISGIDTVYPGAFEDHISIYFYGPE